MLAATQDRRRETGRPRRTAAPRVAPGRVVWITGLAGSGKTTIGRWLLRRLRADGRAAVLLDGNELRRAIARDLGYDEAERRRCAERYARLATLLARQGLDVVVATISMFEAVRRWNRRHAPGYLEVYLRTPAEVRRQRTRRRRVRPGPAVGAGVPFEEPRRPDLVIDDAGLTSAAIGRQVWRRLDPAPRRSSE